MYVCCMYVCMYVCRCLHRSDPMAPGWTPVAAGMIAVYLLGTVCAPVIVVK